MEGMVYLWAEWDIYMRIVVEKEPTGRRRALAKEAGNPN